MKKFALVAITIVAFVLFASVVAAAVQLGSTHPAPASSNPVQTPCEKAKSYLASWPAPGTPQHDLGVEQVATACDPAAPLPTPDPAYPGCPPGIHTNCLPN